MILKTLRIPLSKYFKPASPKPRRIILRPQGEIYDLKEIYHSINSEYFDAKLDLRISWFGSGKIPKRSVLFGSYTYEHKLVKINRILDHEDVPKDFIRYIVYHEMLHNLYPPKRGKRGRRDIHHYEFKQKEREFKEFLDAKEFIKQWRAKHFQTPVSLDSKSLN